MRAIAQALAAAALFGASTPAAKVLVGEMHPVLLAGLLYAGSGIGLALWLAVRREQVAALRRADLPWLGGAILAGGIVAPVLLMFGLSRIGASSASLLLNLESAFTALLAWFVFRENFDRRIALGMLLIVAGGMLVSAGPGALDGSPVGAAAIAAACLAWALDNNLTRRVAAADAVTITCVKGLAAGAVNLAIAFAMLEVPWPGMGSAAGSALVGLLGYGVSLALFVGALRELGAARTGAYFAVAPFVGVALSLLFLGEAPAPLFWLAAALVALGVWLHVSERHEHEHLHEPMEHEHRHVHDAHHQHPHDPAWDGKEPHAHRHRHERLLHKHPHYPDLHHRHH